MLSREKVPEGPSVFHEERSLSVFSRYIKGYIMYTCRIQVGMYMEILLYRVGDLLPRFFFGRLRAHAMLLLHVSGSIISPAQRLAW